MPEPADILSDRVAFDPAEDFDAFLKKVPARWVVYLLTDENDRAVQLLCVKNLRASLKRRLGGQETIGPTRSVNYRDVVRGVYWRRVDSAFEADIVYLEAARSVFPESYQGMVGFRPAWFVHVDPDAKFPRYTKTIDLTKSGVLIGPVEDKHAAARLIELIEDAFDLCRYYNIPTLAPRGKACAYKEMGKCPAPCDGSISMDQYRLMIRWSAEVAVESKSFIRDQQQRMQEAAKELRFETAAKIKAFIEEVSKFGKGPFRHARRLDDFAFVSLQRGPKAGTAKVFIVCGGEIVEAAGIISEPGHSGDLLRHVLEQLELRSISGIDETGAQRIGVVSAHLFSAKKQQGVFIRADELDDNAIVKAYRDLQKQKVTEEGEEEGVVKELQAMGE